MKLSMKKIKIKYFIFYIDSNKKQWKTEKYAVDVR